MECTPSSKKDTRRWCRGKPGREHVRRWTIKRAIVSYNLDACADCGREFRFCYGPWQRGGCICGSCDKDRLGARRGSAAGYGREDLILRLPDRAVGVRDGCAHVGRTDLGLLIDATRHLPRIASRAAVRCD